MTDDENENMDTFGIPSAQTSGGYYAGIGYEQTESVHFEDLKAKQEILKTKAMEVAKEFKVLAKIDREAKKAKVAKLQKAKERKEEEDGDQSGDDDDDSDDDDDDDLELTMRCHSYCAARQEVMDFARSWAKESSNQIAAFPGQRSKERTKRTIDFINLIKIKLRKTTPIGMEQESPEDKEWLENFTTTLPEPDEMAAAAGEEKGLKNRLRGAANAMFGAINSPAKAFSSIRTSTPDTEKNKDGKSTQGKGKRRDEKGRYIKETTEGHTILSKEAPIANLGEDLEDEYPIKLRDHNHDCNEEGKDKEEKEAILRERAADLIRSTGNIKLAKELKEADDRLKAARRDAEEETRKAKEEEERALMETERMKAEHEKKRDQEEES